MYEINRNASVEYTPRARTLEFLNAIARGGIEFRLQVFLGASVHGYIFIAMAQCTRPFESQNAFDIRLDAKFFKIRTALESIFRGFREKHNSNHISLHNTSQRFGHVFRLKLTLPCAEPLTI